MDDHQRRKHTSEDCWGYQVANDEHIARVNACRILVNTVAGVEGERRAVEWG